MRKNQNLAAEAFSFLFFIVIQSKAVVTMQVQHKGDDLAERF